MKNRKFGSMITGLTAIIAVCGILGAAGYLTRHRHTYEWVKVKEAGCTETGWEQSICAECGEVYETRVIGAHGHTAGEWLSVKEPSCETVGEKALLCTVCGAVIETEVMEAMGHTADEWKTTREPTCTEDGVRSLLCARCGDVLETAEIPQTEHRFPAEWTVIREPSCTDEGIWEKTCTDCGKTVTEQLPMTAHCFGAWSKSGGGEQTRTCTVCGYREVIESGITPEQETFDALVGTVAGKYKNVSVTYINPAAGDICSCGNSGVYLTQSTIKAAYCAYLVHIDADISETIRLDTPIKESGSGVLVAENVGKSYTVETLIQYVLKYSDNQAYYMLVCKYGKDGYNAFIREEIGTENPLLSEGALFSYATSAEMAKVMCYIYDHREECAYLISCMSSPLGMIDRGTDKPVAQKYGYNIGNYHDIAIVYDDVPYILSVFTNESANTDVFEKITEAIGKFHETVKTGSSEKGISA